MTILAAHRPGLVLDGKQEILAVVLVDERCERSPRVGVVLAGTAAASVYLLSWTGHVANDFATYRGASALATHGVDVYTVPLPRGLPFTYPPFATVALWPTTVLPAGWSYATWTVISLTALAAVLAAVTPVRDGAVLAIVLVLSLPTGLLGAHLHNGQVSLVLMALCVADLVRRDRTLAPRGLLVGVAAAIKLTPALFIVHFAITRQWRQAAFAVVGFSAATALGALLRPQMTATFFGTEIWSLRDRVDLNHPVGHNGNQSVDGVLAALGVPEAHLPPATLAAVVLLLAAAWDVHRRGRHVDAGLVVGLGAPVVTPFAWNHHHVFVLPALVLLAARGRGPARLAVAGATLLLCVSPGRGDRLLREREWWSVPAGAMIREGTLLVAIGCVLALVWSARRVDG